MPRRLHCLLIRLQLYELRLRACQRNQLLCRTWWFAGTSISGSRGFCGSNCRAGGHGRTVHNTLSHNIPFPDTLVLHDVYSCIDTNAVANDSLKVCILVCLALVCTTYLIIFSSRCRSVSEEERSFALGMQFVIFRLFGYIPAPILFGNLIDSTCLLWKSTCGEKGGRCLIYDIETFRYK